MLTDPEHTVHGGLSGMNTGGVLAHHFEYDRTAAEIGVGVDFQPRDGFQVSLRGEGIFSSSATTGTISARLGWQF